jgi:RNA:NAD 2'-phosphotransferase (TPT1/KptA family)
MAPQSKALAIAPVILPNRRDPQSVRAALSDKPLLSEAIEVVGEMLKGYANGGANASGSYIGALAQVLSHYPRMIALRAGDLVTGVPRETRFLPTPADVISWCERELTEWRTIVERDDRERQLLQQAKERADETARLDAARKLRPTLQQMHEKHGPNWGLSATEKQDLIVKAARDDTMKKANAYAFEEECKAAGVDPARMTVSPTLAKILHTDAAAVEARMRNAEALGRQTDKLAAQEDAA